MTEAEQRAAATKFYNDWHGIGDEKVTASVFGLSFLVRFWESKMSLRKSYLRNGLS